MVTPEGCVNYWRFGDSTLLYDPRFLFPTEELVALAREHARIPGLVHRDMDSDAVARVFGLEGLRVGGDGGGSSSNSSGGLAADNDGGTKGADDAGLDEHREPGYVTVEPSPEEQQELDYVLVGTADEVERERRREVEVERERRREADAEAAFEEGWNNQVRWIEQLLDDDEGDDYAADDDEGDDYADDAEEEAAYNVSRQEDSHDVGSVEQLLDLDEADEESALTARRKKLVRDIDQSLEEEEEEEAGHVPRWNIAVPAIEQHFAYNSSSEAARGRPE